MIFRKFQFVFKNIAPAAYVQMFFNYHDYYHNIYFYYFLSITCLRKEGQETLTLFVVLGVNIRKTTNQIESVSTANFFFFFDFTMRRVALKRQSDMTVL